MNLCTDFNEGAYVSIYMCQIQIVPLNSLHSLNPRRDYQIGLNSLSQINHVFGECFFFCVSSLFLRPVLVHGHEMEM